MMRRSTVLEALADVVKTSDVEQLSTKYRICAVPDEHRTHISIPQ